MHVCTLLRSLEKETMALSNIVDLYAHSELCSSCMNRVGWGWEGGPTRPTHQPRGEECPSASGGGTNSRWRMANCGSKRPSRRWAIEILQGPKIVYLTLIIIFCYKHMFAPFSKGIHSLVIVYDDLPKKSSSLKEIRYPKGWLRILMTVYL